MREELFNGICLVLAFVLVGILTGCADTEYEQMRRRVEIQERIANACTPYGDEQRVMEWTVNEKGQQVLSVSVRKYIGTRKGNLQFELVSAEEVLEAR